jgi:phosphomethylpyrimidine synthase
VRYYAATLNDPHQGLGAEGDQLPSSLKAVGMSMSGVIEDGMAQMSAKFKEMGEQVYVAADAVKESNRVL